MEKIKIGCYVVGISQTNFYFLHRENSKETIVVDPGYDGRRIYDRLTQRGLEIKAIFLTHGHFDHILGVEALKAACGAPVYACALEKNVLFDPMLNISADVRRPCSIKADRELFDGEMVTVAGITMKVISTPGHTEGSCSYYITAEESGSDPILLSGDTLFEESIGRTDFPTGSMHELEESIRTKLYVLPGNTQVFSGHGGSTTIEHEKMFNYFVRA